MNPLKPVTSLDQPLSQLLAGPSAPPAQLTAAVRSGCAEAEDYLESGFSAMTGANKRGLKLPPIGSSPRCDVLGIGLKARFVWAGRLWKKREVSALDGLVPEVTKICEGPQLRQYLDGKPLGIFGESNADYFWGLAIWAGLTAAPVVARGGNPALAIGCCKEVVATVLAAEEREAQLSMDRGDPPYRGMPGFGAGRMDIERGRRRRKTIPVVDTPYIQLMPIALSLGVWTVAGLFGTTAQDLVDDPTTPTDPKLGGAWDSLLDTWPQTGYCNPQALMALAMVCGRFRVEWARCLLELFEEHHGKGSSSVMNSARRLCDAVAAVPAQVQSASLTV